MRVLSHATAFHTLVATEQSYILVKGTDEITWLNFILDSQRKRDALKKQWRPINYVCYSL
jgi:hypothetical protein